MVEVNEDKETGELTLTSEKMLAKFFLKKDPFTDSMWTFSISEGTIPEALVGMYTSKKDAVRLFKSYELARPVSNGVKRKYFRDKRAERDATVPTEDS